MRTTEVFKRNLKAFNQGFRHIVNQGGTSSSKTFSILQLLILIAKSNKGISISVVSETLPHLKMGAMKDFEIILRADGIYNERNHNKTDNKYYFGDSYIQFFSVDQPGKVTGPRRDILYINECNNIPYYTVSQMQLRTNDCIFYDYNPVQDFWITDEVLALPEAKRCLIRSNYRDNDELAPNIREDIEIKAAKDPNFKRVHVDMLFGQVEGLIFSNWVLVDEMPTTDKHSYGLDFGFTNDPTVLMDTRVNGGMVWLDEMFYRTMMTNGDIVREVKALSIKRQIIADSAEPKSIKEIQDGGVSIIACTKGKDSVLYGIQKLQQQTMCVTKRSLNLIKELRNYKWKTVNGIAINEPIDLYNHCIDATRYGAQDLLTIRPKAVYNF